MNTTRIRWNIDGLARIASVTVNGKNKSEGVSFKLCDVGSPEKPWVVTVLIPNSKGLDTPYHQEFYEHLRDAMERCEDLALLNDR